MGIGPHSPPPSPPWDPCGSKPCAPGPAYLYFAPPPPPSTSIEPTPTGFGSSNVYSIAMALMGAAIIVAILGVAFLATKVIRVRRARLARRAPPGAQGAYGPRGVATASMVGQYGVYGNRLGPQQDMAAGMPKEAEGVAVLMPGELAPTYMARLLPADDASSAMPLAEASEPSREQREAPDVSQAKTYVDAESSTRSVPLSGQHDLDLERGDSGE